MFAPKVDAAGGFLHKLDHLALKPLALGEGLGVLVEVADMHGFAQANRALGRFAPSGDEIEQGRFAAAVGPDDAHPVFRAEAVAEVFQQ